MRILQCLFLQAISAHIFPKGLCTDPSFSMQPLHKVQMYFVAQRIVKSSLSKKGETLIPLCWMKINILRGEVSPNNVLYKDTTVAYAVLNKYYYLLIAQDTLSSAKLLILCALECKSCKTIHGLFQITPWDRASLSCLCGIIGVQFHIYAAV